MRFEDSEFVGLIYDTAFDAGTWPTVLNHLADLLGATSGAALVSYNSRARAPSILCPRADPDYIRSFLEYWGHRCLILHYSRNHPFAAVVKPEMFVSREEYCSTEMFNEWFKPQRAEAMIGAKLLIKSHVLTFLGLARPYSSGDFDVTETRLFAALIPHLQRAVQLQLRLSALDGPPEGSAEILNRLLQGVVLVDSHARVIFANRVAERMLRAGAGLVLGRDGLRAQIPDETRRLRQTIADCAEPRYEVAGAGGRIRLSREERAPLTVLVVPHRSRYAWVDVAWPRAVLFIVDPETAAGVRCESLRDDFGLTPAEAALALEILKADGLRAAANRLAISLATAHTELAHIFGKTGTRRQAELVRLILQSQPAVLEEGSRSGCARSPGTRRRIEDHRIAEHRPSGMQHREKLSAHP
jgi:DNA-binding CsgD family transcriptional regulator